MEAASGSFAIKRVHDEPAGDDGYRVLVGPAVAARGEFLQG